MTRSLLHTQESIMAAITASRIATIEKMPIFTSAMWLSCDWRKLSQKLMLLSFPSKTILVLDSAAEELCSSGQSHKQKEVAVARMANQKNILNCILVILYT